MTEPDECGCADCQGSAGRGLDLDDWWTPPWLARMRREYALRLRALLSEAHANPRPGLVDEVLAELEDEARAL